MADELKTPTAIVGAERVAAELNRLVADYFTLYVKTKSFHWHLYGPRFNDLHSLFDQQATELLDAIDPVAERVRKLGAGTITSLGQITLLRALDDENRAVLTAGQMIEALLADNRRLTEQQRGVAVICEEVSDYATGNLLADLIDKSERRVWFLYQLSQKEA